MPVGAATGRPTSPTTGRTIRASHSRQASPTGARPQSLWRYARAPSHGSDRRRAVRAGRRSSPASRSPIARLDLYLKLESENPTRSYKDRIGTVAVSAALDLGLSTLCCSSTGNLGDAVAAAASATGLEAVILVPAGSASAAIEADHRGVSVLAVRGTYDDCRRLELELGSLFPWGFVSGNLHPFASEGAKTISFEIAEQLGWQLPDAVVCPAASGTLFAKLAQGFAELTRAGLAREPLPRMFAAQAEGASPIAAAFADDRAHLTRAVAHPRQRRLRSATRPTATSRSAPRAQPAARCSLSRSRRSSRTPSCCPSSPGLQPTTRAAPRSVHSSPPGDAASSSRAHKSSSSSPAGSPGRRSTGRTSRRSTPIRATCSQRSDLRPSLRA